MTMQIRSRRDERQQAFRRHLESIKPENQERGGIDLAQSVLARREQLTAHQEAERAKAKAAREARRKARQQAVADQRDKGTPELRRHKSGRVRTQSLLQRYLARRSISGAQFQAGERLYAAREAAGASSAPIGSYAPKVDKSIRATSVLSCAMADDRYKRALEAMGPGLAPIAVHVCINDQSAEEWARAKGKPLKDGIALLRAALDLLVDHWRPRGRQVPSNKDIELSGG